MTTQVAPFRADHVGSLLRPERIHKARKDISEGTISKEELYNIETEEITKIVDKQIEVVLQAVTDGVFRSLFLHTDFLECIIGIEVYVPDTVYIFKGMVTERYNV